MQDYNYDYDTVGRLTFAQEIAYNNNGSVASDRRWGIGHDDADRLLTSAPAVGSAANTPWYEYAYDRADNRGAAFLNGINQTITINTLNEATQVNATAYSYDLNGNLLNDGVRTYAWDAENRLIGVTTLSTGATVSYQFDGLGRRIGSTAGGVTYRHLWCDGQVCETRNASTGALVNGTEFDEGSLVGSTQILYFRDQLGSVRQLRPRVKSVKVSSFDYGPYGETLASSDPLTAGERYAGMYYDSAVGLNLTWYRAYAPGIGRWLNRDPIGVTGGNNLYGYVGDGPLGGVDSLGLFKWGDSLPDWLVNGGVGLGSGVVKSLSFGYSDGSFLGIDINNADQCSATFKGAQIAGMIDGAGAFGGLIGRGAKLAFASKGVTPVIGRLPDTIKYANRLGFEIVNSVGWTPEANAAWIQAHLEAGNTFRLASSISEANMLSTTNASGFTFFAEEISQILNSGYVWRGAELIPGP